MNALAKEKNDDACNDWTDVGKVDMLFAGRACHGVQVEGRRIGLFLVDGCVHAIDDICTHGNALLSDGELEGHEIECPLHAGLVDVRDGRALCSPLTRDAVVHQARLTGGKVWIRIGGAS